MQVWLIPLMQFFFVRSYYSAWFFFLLLLEKLFEIQQSFRSGLFMCAKCERHFIICNSTKYVWRFYIPKKEKEIVFIRTMPSIPYVKCTTKHFILVGYLQKL